jgi:3-oxoacyl-[acyl-carrier-protein] synthase II
MLPRAITGYGVTSTVGIGREAFLAALRSPHPLEPEKDRKLATLDVAKYPNARAFEVPGFDASKYLGDKGLRTLDRLTKLAVVAARLALADSGLKKDNQFVALSQERVGIICSNAYGSLEAITELNRVAKLEDPRYINPAVFPNTVANSASGYVSIWEGLRALNVAISDGNCGALDAVACADIHLAQGRADALLVGGAEAMHEALFLAFSLLGTLDQPEHANLVGHLSLGEGAAFLVVEREKIARARGAKILAEIVGYGTSFESPEEGSTLIGPSGDALGRAVLNALADAKLDPSDVDVVASSLSGLHRADDAERVALDRVFGEHVPIAAPKLVLGETLGAGGAFGMAAALAWLEGAPPSVMISGKAPESPTTVLVTSLGFYGNASAVVLRSGDEGKR